MGAQFGDERSARLYRYWWEKRGSRPAPFRADLNPVEIPDLLPIINLIDVTWADSSGRRNGAFIGRM